MGRQPSPVLVRYLVVLAILSDLLTARGSQDTAVHRCHKGVTGYCEGIYRRISPPQVVFRWYQCVDQALRGELISNFPPILLTIIDQQYKDVQDKLSDLTPWLEKLLKTLAKVNPNDDSEEKERRSQLARFALGTAYLVQQKLTIYRSLEYIGKRSLALSGKGRVARVLDKTQDSQEVIGLVEKLRQAVLIYQVGSGHCQNRRPLTRGTGVATTVDIQPSRRFEGECLLPLSDFSD